MTSIPVKDIGSVMSRTAPSGVGKTPQSTSAASFEEVWNQQTEKNASADMEIETGEPKEFRTEEENNTIRDSLKAKETRENTTVSESETTDDKQTDSFDNMNSEEWELAMEVLGSAAVDVMQEIASAFGMTMEEVQSIMSELGMKPLDILQQDNLGQLLLAAGGEQDTTALLTNENLYQAYQTVMEQLNAVLEQSSDTLQMDAEQIAQAIAQTPEDTMSTENLPVVEVNVAEDVELQEAEVVQEAIDDTVQSSVGEILNVTTKQQSGDEMQGDMQNQMQNQTREHMETGKETVEDRVLNEPVVLQNFRTENLEVQLQQITQTTSTWDGESLDIMKQIMDYMKIQVKPDMSNLEMQLHPESLGTLQVHVASKGGVVTAQFVTQNEAVKAALESQMIQLKESFAEQGVKVDAIEVVVQTHQFEQNLEQGRGRQQEEQGRRNGIRRIRLDGALTMEELEGMDEEEQLAAQMMETNGNTVDYTA